MAKVTIKSVESAVRDLITTVTMLVNKVDALETKISQQNDLIEQLTSDKDKTPPSLAVKTTVNRKSGVAPPPALQRPVRATRLGAGVTSGRDSTAIKRFSDVTKSTRMPNASSPVTTDLCKKTCDDIPSVATKTAKVESCQLTVMATKPKALPPQIADPEADNEEGWKTQRGRKTKKSRRTVQVGSAKNDSIQGVESLKYIQAWSFRPETTREQVLNFLNNVKVSEEYFVEKRTLQSARHASFIIGVPEGLFDCINTPAVWPQGVRYSDWFLRRPRSQQRLRGEQDNACDVTH